MYNKSQLSRDKKNAKKQVSMPNPFGKDVDYVSQMGYRDDSPFKDRPYIDINTPNGTIDMSNTGVDLIANGRFLPKYSGTHQFDTNVVREERIAEEGGEYLELDEDQIDAYRAGGYIVEELPEEDNGGVYSQDIPYPPKHNPANSFAVNDPRSMQPGGGVKYTVDPRNPNVRIYNDKYAYNLAKKAEQDSSAAYNNYRNNMTPPAFTYDERNWAGMRTGNKVKPKPSDKDVKHVPASVGHSMVRNKYTWQGIQNNADRMDDYDYKCYEGDPRVCEKGLVPEFRGIKPSGYDVIDWTYPTGNKSRAVVSVFDKPKIKNIYKEQVVPKPTNSTKPKPTQQRANMVQVDYPTSTIAETTSLDENGNPVTEKVYYDVPKNTNESFSITPPPINDDLEFEPPVEAQSTNPDPWNDVEQRSLPKTYVPEFTTTKRFDSRTGKWVEEPFVEKGSTEDTYNKARWEWAKSNRLETNPEQKKRTARTINLEEEYGDKYKSFAQGGSIMDLDLTEEEIEQYRRGGYIVEELPTAQDGLETGVVESKTPWAGAANVTGEETTPPVIFEGKDVTVKAQGPEWARYQREYQNTKPWEDFLYGEQKNYLRKNKGLNKAAGVSMDNFPEAERIRIKQKYDQKMNDYITRRLGKSEGFNPRRRGEWVDQLTDREKQIVAGSRYGSKLQPDAWSRFMSGARSIYNAGPLSNVTGDITTQIPGYTKKENKAALNNWAEGMEAVAPLDIPGIVIANKIKNMNAENPSWYSGEMMANVDYLDVVAMNPLTLLDLYGLPKAGLSLGRGVVKGSKALGQTLETQKALLSNAYDKVATGNSLLTDLGVRPWKVERPANNSLYTGLSRPYIARTATDEEAKLLSTFGRGMQFDSQAEWDAMNALTKSGFTDFSKSNTPISRVLGYYRRGSDEQKAIEALKRGDIFATPSEESIRTWSAGVPKIDADSHLKGSTRLIIPSRYTKDLGNYFSAMPYDDIRVGFIHEDKVNGIQPYLNVNAILENELMGNIPKGFKVIGTSSEDGLNNLIIKPLKKSGSSRQFTRSNKGYEEGGTSEPPVKTLPEVTVTPGGYKGPTNLDPVLANALLNTPQVQQKIALAKGKGPTAQGAKAIKSSKAAQDRAKFDEQYYNQMQAKADWEKRSSGAAQPVDEVWQLPLGLRALGTIGAIDIPYLGASVGELGNLAGMGYGATQLPGTAKSWYDYGKGDVSLREAIGKTALNSLDFLGARTGYNTAKNLIGTERGLMSIGKGFKPAALTREEAMANLSNPELYNALDRRTELITRDPAYVFSKDAKELGLRGIGDNVDFRRSQKLVKAANDEVERLQKLYDKSGTSFMGKRINKDKALANELLNATSNKVKTNYEVDQFWKQRSADRLRLPINLKSTSKVGEGAFTEVYPTTFDENTLVKIGNVPQWETPETMQHIVNVGKELNNPRLGLPFKTVNFGEPYRAWNTDTQSEIFKPSKLYAQLMPRVPGRPGIPFNPSQQAVEEYIDMIKELEKRNIHLDYINTQNTMYDDATDQFSIIDVNTTPDDMFFLENVNNVNNWENELRNVYKDAMRAPNPASERFKAKADEIIRTPLNFNEEFGTGGSYVDNQMTHFQNGGNMDPGNNALELHMFYDKDVYKEDGGYVLPQAQNGMSWKNKIKKAFNKEVTVPTNEQLAQYLNPEYQRVTEGQEISVKPTGEQISSTYNDFMYSKAEAESDQISKRASDCFSESGYNCAQSAFSYYDKYVAPKLPGGKSSWQLKESAGMYSGDEGGNPSYKDAERSWDSWDLAGGFKRNKGKLFFTSKDNNNRPLNDKFKDMNQTQIEQYYRDLKLPLGTIINGGGADDDDSFRTMAGDTGKGYNTEQGLAASNHTTIVVGYDRYGTPYIYDEGHIYSIADPKALVNTMGITNIISPRENTGYTFDKIKKGKNWQQKIEKLNLNLPGASMISDIDEMKPFMSQLEKNKKDMMNTFKMSNDEYDEYAKRAVATALTETKGGQDDASWRYGIVPAYVTDKIGIGDSQGITQIDPQAAIWAKKNGKFNNPDLVEQLDDLGISELNYDPWNPNHQAIVTMGLLKENKKLADTKFKEVKGNNQDLADPAKGYYMWNSPRTVYQGEAQGDNINVKRFMDYYDMLDMYNKKDGGDVEYLTQKQIDELRAKGYHVVEE